MDTTYEKTADNKLKIITPKEEIADKAYLLQREMDLTGEIQRAEEELAIIRQHLSECDKLEIE